jgi:valyl-tRNA synthetase
MSKSLGTGVDPIDLIEGGPRPPVFAQVKSGPDAGDFPAYGADALRWGLLAMSSGQDVRFSEDKVAQGQQLTNKLWNASRLILQGVGPDARANPVPTRVEDRWILSRLERARLAITERIETFDLAHAALDLYDFVFGELCDWYLELVKPRLRDGEPELPGTLVHILTETLTLAHPIIPFVTEEVWSYVPGATGLLAQRVTDGAPVAELDEDSEQAMHRVIEAVQALRRWRNSADVKAAARPQARLRADGYEQTAETVGLLARVTFDAAANGAEPAATIPVAGGAIDIMPGGELDLSAAEERRDKERARLQSEIDRAEKKLSNQGFVAKAPPDVVQAERDKLARMHAELEAL